jgi:hypothetical protein
MKLPGGARAIVEVSKLRDYCLAAHHPRGRHKARVFLSALGLGPAEAGILRDALLAAAREGDALAGDVDEYGARYTVDFQMTRDGRETTVRSAWIVLRGESAPRLTSCFVILD